MAKKKKNKYAIDHLGREMTADQICEALAVMLKWGNVPPWPVLERNIRELVLSAKAAWEKAGELELRMGKLEQRLEDLTKLEKKLDTIEPKAQTGT